jgi:hypothetical protein
MDVSIPILQVKGKLDPCFLQGNSTYSPGLKKHQNIEEILTIKK